MTDWHVYSLQTGLFVGICLTGDAAHVAENVPEKCAAVGGVTDWQSQRIDLATGQLVDYQPPPPPGDALRTWAWHDEARRWLPQPTLAALIAERIAPVQAAIEAAEAAQARPMGEVLGALLAGQPAPDVPRQRLAAIAEQLAHLRAVRAALSAATTPADLAAITWPSPPG